MSRAWYRLLDFVQYTWQRFAESRTGRSTIWFVAVFLWTLFRFAVRVAGWALIVGGGVLFVGLSFALGQGKLAKSITSANRN